jgi:hypothetical protein
MLEDGRPGIVSPVDDAEHIRLDPVQVDVIAQSGGHRLDREGGVVPRPVEAPVDDRLGAPPERSEQGDDEQRRAGHRDGLPFGEGAEHDAER